MQTYLWTHQPELSDEPIDRLYHKIDLNNNEIDEIAIFKLKNDKYLYIKFVGTIDNLECGVTDVEEFDELSEAKKIYDLYVW